MVTYPVLSLLLGCILPMLCVGKFLWFEAAPERDDRCTNSIYGLQEVNWVDVHPDPTCSKGGLLWLGTWGRVHSHFFLDSTTKSNFRLCLTAGEANSIVIWYDYRGKYWEPLGFPNYQGHLSEKDRCRNSYKGVLDLFFEAPWHKIHYLAFVKWEITPYPADWVEDAEEVVEPSQEPDLEEIMKGMEKMNATAST